MSTPTDALTAHLHQALRVLARNRGGIAVPSATPRRVARALLEQTAGYAINPSELLARTFQTPAGGGIVAVRGMEFSSTCAHHLMPFIGRCGVAYIPRRNGRTWVVVGLSKIPRLVDAYARRLQLQEAMTAQIADALAAPPLRAAAVLVIIEATHTCMACRGVRKHATMVTSHVLGRFRSNASARAEALGLLR